MCRGKAFNYLRPLKSGILFAQINCSGERRMAALISRKLPNSFQGALAGGGDPATSPLYVFGPFLKLIVIAGVANVAFGAAVWLAVFTVVMVSLMYRQVMAWVTDGSGGSGLSEEEFGSWAVKIDAGIALIEYSLTFLVSMAALVTFIADRFPMLNGSILGFQYRVFLCLGFSAFICWVVNLGPRISVRTFGPATAAVLVLLWAMIFTTIYKTGFHLPSLDLQAFSFSDVSYLNPEGQVQNTSYIHLTLGGYARILALMTGIEIFANLVAAYEGKRAEKSKKAFGSLAIIMGTTAITMLIVGPAIFAHSDPLNANVSVFTQTMDFLLPPALSYAGTLISVAVLLSACAAASQGIQNLSLGLRYRHYVSARLGQRNTHDVAAMPVWIMFAVTGACFLLFGTNEETYLALYAAGVFIMLSMAGWAASKRLFREFPAARSPKKVASLVGTLIAALLTTCATIIIFEERFFEGAWIYLALVPVFYTIFTFYRNRLGAPSFVEDRIGLAISGQGYVPQLLSVGGPPQAFIGKILLPLNGSTLSAQALPLAGFLAHAYGARIELLGVSGGSATGSSQQSAYLDVIADRLALDGLSASRTMCEGDVAATIDLQAGRMQADLIVMTTGTKSAVTNIFHDSTASRVIKKTLTPTLLIRPTEDWRSRHSNFKHVLVALDGSEAAESVLPYIRIFTNRFHSKVRLLSVPEGSESEAYGGIIEKYLNDIAATLRDEEVDVTASFVGSGAARTILDIAREENVDLIMMASHGRGGIARSEIHLGSETAKVAQETNCPLFVVPLTRSSK